jgi:hypothetical protein
MLVPVAALAAFATAASVAAAPAGPSTTPLARGNRGNHGYATVRDIGQNEAGSNWCHVYAESTPYRVVLSNDFLADTPPAFCRNVTVRADLRRRSEIAAHLLHPRQMTATENGNSWHGVVVNGSSDYAFSKHASQCTCLSAR